MPDRGEMLCKLVVRVKQCVLVFFTLHTNVSNLVLMT